MMRKCLPTSYANPSQKTIDTADLFPPQKQQIHTVLSKAQVLEIFRFKASASPKGTRLNNAISSSTVAKWYGVCSKTIRDIWMGRTWYRATLPLEPGRVDSNDRLRTQAGRPKGSKDSKPRTRRKPTNASFTTWSVIHDSFLDDRCIDDSVLNFLDNFDFETGEFTDPFHDDWQHW